MRTAVIVTILFWVAIAMIVEIISNEWRLPGRCTIVADAPGFEKTSVM
jgi:hypothetical protein